MTRQGAASAGSQGGCRATPAMPGPWVVRSGPAEGLEALPLPQRVWTSAPCPHPWGWRFTPSPGDTEPSRPPRSRSSSADMGGCPVATRPPWRRRVRAETARAGGVWAVARWALSAGPQGRAGLPEWRFGGTRSVLRISERPVCAGVCRMPRSHPSPGTAQNSPSVGPRSRERGPGRSRPAGVSVSHRRAPSPPATEVTQLLGVCSAPPSPLRSLATGRSLGRGVFPSFLLHCYHGQ